MAIFSSSSMDVVSNLSHSAQLVLPKISQFKIGICQLTVTRDKNNNIANACDSIQVAAKQGAKLVLLPEMWNCPYSHSHFSKFAEYIDDRGDGRSPTISMLSEVASCFGITIIAGSIPERSANLLYNTCCVFGPDGMLKAKHRKMHMFDIDIPGDIFFKESDVFAAGEGPTVVDTDVGRIGIGICHDIRFPELAMLYRERGAHLICYPGAFNMSTGQMLWELEQRARAADNQLYVATCSPSRDSAGSYMIWGHSTLVGPLGEIVATTGYKPTILIAQIDYSAIQQTRFLRLKENPEFTLNLELERTLRRQRKEKMSNPPRVPCFGDHYAVNFKRGVDQQDIEVQSYQIPTQIVSMITQGQFF